MSELVAKMPLAVLSKFRDNGMARVYAVLTGYVDNTGCCAPSHALLVEHTGLHKRTVERALRRLRTAGLVVVESVGSGRRTTNYWLPDLEGWEEHVE